MALTGGHLGVYAVGFPVVYILAWLAQGIAGNVRVHYERTGLLFFEIVQAGALGIVQALLVVAVIWYACFWLSQNAPWLSITYAS